MDNAAGAPSVALAQGLSAAGQTQALEGVVQGSGALSLSTVGRILARLVRLKRIRLASFDGRAGQAQRHRFQGYAKRWQ